MSGLFDSQSLDIPCPQCGKKTPQTVAWLKANAEMVCPGCQTVIALDRDQLFATIKQVEKRLGRFRQAVRRFRSTIKLR